MPAIENMSANPSGMETTISAEPLPQRAPFAARVAWRLRRQTHVIRSRFIRVRRRLKAKQGLRKKLAEALRIFARALTSLRAMRNGPALQATQAVATSADGVYPARDARDFENYRLWLDRLEAGTCSAIPPLNFLRAELTRREPRRAEFHTLEFPTSAEPLVSIVIPVCDRHELTYRCLCAVLFAYNDTPFEVIIVDDASSDATLQLGKFVRGIEILRHSPASGFSETVRSGLARARGRFVVILDNGSEVAPRWLDELVAVFRNFDRVGLAASQIATMQSGTPNSASSPDCFHKADAVPGAAVMLPRAVWQEIGGGCEGLSPREFGPLLAKVRETKRFTTIVPASLVYANSNITRFPGEDEAARFTTGSDAIAHPGQVFGPGKSRGNRDSEVAFRVLFIEQEYPQVDRDAGSYAAFQEMRMFQALGAHVSFLPGNLAEMGRHTTALRRIGIRCLHAPLANSFAGHLFEHAGDYDLVYVARHRMAEQVIPLVRSAAPGTRIVFNLADLHFLREQRESAAGTPGYSEDIASQTRRKELAAVAASDLTFSYSDVELRILEHQTTPGTKLARMPWVVDTRPRRIPFGETQDLLFLGSFSHPPNSAAATFFARRIMPLLRKRLPTVAFKIIGSGAEAAVLDLASDSVHVVGHLPNLGDCLERARVFVAPLLAGAGLKGKVLDALAHGVPSVLSPIAAEGIGLAEGVECLIAESEEDWVECVYRLYTDEVLWTRLATNALQAAETRFTFAKAVSILEKELARIGLKSRREWGLPYRYARPDRYVG